MFLFSSNNLSGAENNLPVIDSNQLSNWRNNLEDTLPDLQILWDYVSSMESMSQYLFYCINMMMNTFLIRTRCNKGRSSIHHLRWNRITCRILNIIVSPLPIDSSMQGMMSKLKITVGKTITTHMKPFFFQPNSLVKFNKG